MKKTMEKPMKETMQVMRLKARLKGLKLDQATRAWLAAQEQRAEASMQPRREPVQEHLFPRDLGALTRQEWRAQLRRAHLRALEWKAAASA